MPNFKFFNIGKANEEVTRLESELSTAQAALTTANENASAIEKNAETVSTELAQVKADLVTAKASISTLTARAEKADADLKVANEKIANPSEEVKILASKEALKITAAQGQPPISAEKTTDLRGEKTMSRSEFKAMKPAEATAFFKAGGKITD